MSSINKVLLIAHLGRDPEVRYTPSGVAVCNVSAATSRSWKDKNTGEKVEETEWHRLVAYDRLAEVIGEYLKAVLLVPALDGAGVDICFRATSKLTKAECSDLLEYVSAYAATNGVITNEDHG